MNWGAMTWACLVLSAAAAQPDEWPMNQRSFQIPIRFDPQKRAELKELDLYVSHDRGQTWNLAGRAKPENEYFPFTANEDGPYWFTMAVVDARGRQEPADIKAAAVGQRILVDTTRPDIRIDVDRQADHVRVAWKITEEHPKPETLKLEYADSQDGPWTSVPIKPGPEGRAEFSSASAAVVRMQMQDMAENQGVAIKAVSAAGSTAGAAPPPPAVTPVGSPPPPPPPPPAPGDLTGPPANDHAHDVSHWQDRGAGADSGSPTPLPPPPTPPAPNALPQPDPTPPAAGPPAAGPKGGNQVVAYSSSNGSGPVGAGPDAPPAGHGEMPAVQIVNRKQVRMEFDVGKFGPSGLGGVDVFITTDDGATWTKQKMDASSAGIQGVEARAGAARGWVTVTLASEGVTYGYTIVARSKAGLGKPDPRPGDMPQIRVELDATPPAATLFEPKADPERRDTLVLTWQAQDKHLTPAPITLEWSASLGPDAQWSPIGQPEMENSGSFSWQPGADVPPNVYLRMTVRDTAGNRSVAQTPKPVLIDLSVPEVTNIGLGGVGLR